MGNSKEKQEWLELLGMTMVMTIFSIIAIMYLPFIIVLIPAPFIVYNLKTDTKLGVLSFLLVSLNLALAISLGMGIVYVLMFTPFIIAIDYMIKNQKKFSEILFSGTVVLFISILILSFISNQAIDASSIDVEEYTQEAIETQIKRLESTGLSGKELADASEILENGYSKVLEIMPFIILALSMAITFINLKLTSVGLSSLEDYIVNDPKFYMFRLPNDIVRGALVMFIATVLMGLVEISYSEIIRLNISMIIGLLVTIQGFAILSYLLNKRKVNKVLKFIFYITTIVIIPALIAVYIVGILDVFFDFRKIRLNEK